MGKPPTSEWGRRAHAAGLDQNTLALLADTHPTTVSRGLNGKFGGLSLRLCSVIIAWEMMDAAMRQVWVATMQALRKPPEG